MDVPGLKARANEAFQDGDFAAALRHTKQAIQLCSSAAKGCGELSRLHSNAAAALMELQDYAAAAREAEIAIELDPSWHRSYLRLCLALASQGRADSAAHALRRGLRACQSADQLAELQAALPSVSAPVPESGGAGDDVGGGCRKRARPQPPHGADANGADGNGADANGADSGRHAPAAPQRRTGAEPPPRAGFRCRRVLPVTALCGFLGAGKTTLVQHVLAELGEGAAARVGLLVNDLAALNVDAGALTMAVAPAPAAPAPAGAPAGEEAAAPQVPGPRPPAAPAGAGEVVSLSNGCVCCNLRGELQDAIRRLVLPPKPPAPAPAACAAAAPAGGGSLACDAPRAAAAGAGWAPLVDQLVVECTGVGEPAALAEALAALGPELAAAGGVELVLRLVTVVDASTFLGLLAPAPQPQPQHLAAGLATPAEGAAGGRTRAPQPQPASRCGGLSSSSSGVQKGSQAPSPQPQPQRQPLATLLAQQVETADVVLLNKCDRLMDRLVGQQEEEDRAAAAAALASVTVAAVQAGGEGERQQVQEGAGARQSLAKAAQAELRRVAAAVRALNPSARVLPCVRCRVPLEDVLASTELQPAGAEEAGAEEAGVGGGVQVGGPGGRLLLAAARSSGTAATAADGGVGGAAAGSSAASAAELTEAGQMQAAAAAAQLGEAPADGRAHEEEEYGIGTLVFSSRRPFHPARLWALLTALSEPQAAAAGLGAEAEAGSGGRISGGDGGEEASRLPPPPPLPPAGARHGGLPCAPPALLRAKGVLWIASMAQAMWELSLAGGEVELAAAGRWLCSMVDREHWPLGAAGDGAGDGTAAADAAGVDTAASGAGGGGGKACWHPVWGDRESGLVFIGVGLLNGDDDGGEGGGGDGGGALQAGVEGAAGGSGSPQQGQEDGATLAPTPAPGSPAERLAVLLRWALLTAEEEAGGEEAWEALDDAAWLGLLERY